MLLGHTKIVPEINGRFLQRCRSSHKIASNYRPFLKKIYVLIFETNLSRSQNLRNVGAITILNDGRKPPMRRFLWELSRFLKTCRIV
ncbi:hypothetical protein C4Q31_06925 [Leptospira borgpetersenii serovar Ceylonica]|nr:hypothetical protein C4Q31_06925 [Leptospira borgpetersenii serovar Ceylonica]